jgi:glutamate-ammonia-ligase adenylyltransferase
MATSPNQSELVEYLDKPQAASDWLLALGFANPPAAHRNLVGMAQAGVTIDLLAHMCQRFSEEFPKISDPDMALNNLERFISNSRSPLALASLFERDVEALPILLQIFSTSQFISDLLIAQPETYDLLRITEGKPFSRELLIEDLSSELKSNSNEQTAASLINLFKKRELARIAYGDIIGRQRLEVVTRQISYLADAVCEAALLVARASLTDKFGEPKIDSGEPAKFVVMGLGKLGGCELNYSSDIDLVFFFDESGRTDGKRRVSNQEYFERLARKTVQILSDTTESGTAYRVDLRLRPDGGQGAVVIDRAAALHYYDVTGRTWERQAFIKARPVAGDLEFGADLLSQLQPWVYRQQLSRSDITEIKALKRKIESSAETKGQQLTNVKVGHGGIRDIEFVIQFLQLLHGGDLPSVRTGNTQNAIACLENEACLSMTERTLLEENYVFLRRIEHILQIMFDRQTHSLPTSDDELRKLAIRMGYSATDGDPLPRFKDDLRDKTNVNRSILDHLLHDAFSDDEQIDPEVDLVLGQTPDGDHVRNILAPYGFQDPMKAYQQLIELSKEDIPFFNSRRCRHFFAAIVPALLKQIAATPNPDDTILSLARVSASLGGKAVLWELFSFNPPILQLYVRLCAASPYLSEILISNPGMIDELMDSLTLSKHPRIEELEWLLDDLCGKADDIDPILHGFKNTMHLRVGVRDILRKDDIQTTTAMLCDVAEVCLRRIAQTEYDKLVKRYGVPHETSQGTAPPQPSRFVILGVGKLGGREPNYHSDLDVVFLYESEGTTRHLVNHRESSETTSCQHFYSGLSQRIIRAITRMGPTGRLFEMDPRLRPTGRNGSIAVSFAEFARYFESGAGQLWERQALCKARPVYGEPTASEAAMKLVHEAIIDVGWDDSDADTIRDTRYQLERTANVSNLKRGLGGTVDLEFLVQILQLRECQDHPEVLVSNTFDAIKALQKTGALTERTASFLHESYTFLRSVEARLRLMNTTARHDMPTRPDELATLAHLLGHADSGKLIEMTDHYRSENRRQFEACVEHVLSADPR